jgi:hypothetical protein
VLALPSALLLLAAAPSDALPEPPRTLFVDYVALGDSYTSGPLVLPFDTTFVPVDCGQSALNYPHLVAKALQVRSFVDMSCGSATLDDLVEPQAGLPAGGINRPQLDAVGPGTDVITLGMGGNDIGIAGAAVDCVRLLGPPFEAPCRQELTAGGIDRLARRTAATEVELGAALDALHANAPKARIFVVGYPVALPADGVACWPYLPIVQQDLTYLAERFLDMNRMLARTARAHGAGYVDTYTSSVGHDACQLPLVAWVNGAVVVPPSFPAHPNQLGMANSAREVARAIRR